MKVDIVVVGNDVLIRKFLPMSFINQINNNYLDGIVFENWNIKGKLLLKHYFICK